MSGLLTRFRGGLFFGGALAFVLAGFGGCHSAFVEATIDNQASSALRQVEVDYPSASFGVDDLAAHSQFHYRFKIQGSGPLKLQFTDAAGHIHDVDGPDLRQGQEGHLAVVIDPAGDVSWKPALTPPK